MNNFSKKLFILRKSVSCRKKRQGICFTNLRKESKLTYTPPINENSNYRIGFIILDSCYRKSDSAKVNINNWWQDFPVQSIMSKVKHVGYL